MTESLWLTFLQAATLTLGAGALFALPVGVGLLFAPHRLAKAAFMLDRWVSLERLLQRLEKNHRLERYFYRHHKRFGLFLAVSAAYNLYFQATYPAARLGALFSTGRHAELAHWLLTSAWWTLLAGNAVALLVGLTVFRRPSLLKGVEAIANRWVGDEPLNLALDRSHFGVQRTLYRHRQLTGLVIVGAALYILATLGLYAPRLF